MSITYHLYVTRLTCINASYTSFHIAVTIIAYNLPYLPCTIPWISYNISDDSLRLPPIAASLPPQNTVAADLFAFITVFQNY